MRESQSKKKEREQEEIIRKYRLGKHDRSIIIFGGIAGSTGCFPRKQEGKSVEKLIRLGLLKKVPTKYGFDFLLTAQGWKAHSKIYSNF